jgi:hypothetical protein
LEAIGLRRRPAKTPITRNTSFERQVWRVTAEIAGFRLEVDGDIHLVLLAAGFNGTAEMPAAGCLPKRARDRKALVRVRQQFVAACGQPTSSWRPLSAIVKISGVGFWDKPHTQKLHTKKPHAQTPHAPNFAELDPVTALRVEVGCT